MNTLLNTIGAFLLFFGIFLLTTNECPLWIASLILLTGLGIVMKTIEPPKKQN